MPFQAQDSLSKQKVRIQITVELSLAMEVINRDF